MVAALCLAVTPIFVAASGNNTVDNLLVLALILACLAIFIAAEKGKLKYFIISLVLVGIGFNIKMVEAYMVAPAIYITYLLSNAIPLKKRVKHIIVGTVVLLLVSLSWALVVDLTPAANRPFVGSSTNNSVMELIIGHNGLERIGLGGMGNSSKAGIARLFSNNNLSDQISSLLPFALLGFLAAAIREKLKAPFDNRRKLDLILWFTWLLPECIYFSFTKGSFHTYYLTTMAPSIAALVGIGLAAMWEFYKEGGWKSWLLPAAFIVNASVEILILSYNYGRSSGYKTIILVTAILVFISSIVLAVVNISKRRRNTLENSNRQREDSGVTNNSKLIKFLEANKTSEKYLVAVPSAMTYASDLILKTGEPVMTIGGFSGSDKIITVDQFKQLVNSGVIRYAIVSGDSGSSGFMGGSSNSDITNWIEENGKVVASSEWQDSTTSNKQIGNERSGGYGGRNFVQLYDLK